MTGSEKKHIRWGIAGCGQIAVDRSIPGLLAAEGARLVAIADPLPHRKALALGLAATAGIKDIKVYDTDVQMLEDPNIDAVYIAIPTGVHSEAVIAAAKAKKAILCEKPMGRNPVEVRRMVLNAQENGVPLMTAYMSRFGDVYRKAVQLVHDGAIGKVTFVSSNFSYPCLGPYPPGAPGGWRWTDAEGGGPLLDIGVYLVFGIREILGERIVRVAPFNGDTIAPPEAAVQDTTAAWFITDKGTPGTIVTTFSHSAQNINFFGTEGNIMVTDLFRQTPGAILELSRNGAIEYRLDTKTDSSLAVFDNYRREFEHFSQAIMGGTPHSPSAQEVLADAIVLEALKQNSSSFSVTTPGDFLKSQA